MSKRKQGSATRTARRGTATTSPSTPGTELKPVSGTFAVAAECTVADAGSLKSSLANLIENSDVVILDISAIQRIDTAGLQVITAFVRERESHGRQVEWRGAAPALSAAAQLLGLTALLKLPTGQAVETAP